MSVDVKKPGSSGGGESVNVSTLFDAPVLKPPIAANSTELVNEPFAALLNEPPKHRRFTLRAATLVCLVIILLAGIVVWGRGFHAEHSNPGFWQMSLVGMLFWMGVTQGMVALSAILRICHASWRYSLTRLLDMSSLFGLWVFALLPFMVAARHRIYELGSSHYNNNVWRVAGSDFWDALTVGTCYLAGWLLLYLTAIPDITVIRDRAPKGSLLSRLSSSVGHLWVGDQRQWTQMRRTEGVIVVGVLVSFVASQTILGWDFQLASARDWDSSIFAPLYTLGSLLSATAMIVLVGTVANKLITGQVIMEERHYENLARLSIALGLIWFYFRWCDYLTAWYEHIPQEWVFQGNRITAFPILAVMMVFGCFAIPVFANLFKNIRRSAVAQCVIAICVLSGITIQRYLDTVPTFAPNYPNSALIPGFGGIFVSIGLAAMFIMTYLVAARFIPAVSWWGKSRELTRSDRRKFGNGEVTVMIEDPPLWET